MYERLIPVYETGIRQQQIYETVIDHLINLYSTGSSSINSNPVDKAKREQTSENHRNEGRLPDNGLKRIIHDVGKKIVSK